MRLFTAIPIPEELKKYAASIKGELARISADVKWVETQNYHLTLKFLGEVPEDSFEQICDFLERAAVSSPAFKIRLKGMGFFPNQRRPRVIWIGIDGDLDQALFLGDRVDAYLSAFGFEMEERRSYHLTLGRIRSEKNLAPMITKIIELQKSVQSNLFTVKEFYLMESQLTSQGPTYTIKRKFTLD